MKMNRIRKRFQVGIFFVAALLSFSACESQAVQTIVPEGDPAEESAQTKPEVLPTMTPLPSPTPEPTEVPPTAIPPTPIPEPIDLINAGFEEGTLNGWESSSPANVTLDDRGREGDFRLTHEGDEAYRVETTQTVNNLKDDWYTLRAWVRSSGGLKESFIALRCGENEKRVYIPSTSPGYRWLNVVVSMEVTGGECQILVFSDADGGEWVSVDEFELFRGRTSLSILGADISSLKKSEDLGGVYRDADGSPGDALQILKDHGLNYARVRVWLDPADGYHNKEQLLIMAKRFQEKGIGLLVDFHYSDDWADPGKQYKPAAWEDLEFEDLKQALYDHTFDVCAALVEQGTPPEMVQVGNEINAGMLWPDGMYDQMDNLAELLKAGYKAVKDCSPSTLVILHIAEGGDNELAKWWFGNITARDVPFDVIGISYYAFWHGTFAELQYNLNDITERYQKDVVVVETAYAFTDQNNDFLPNIVSREMAIPGYPITIEGQRAMLRDVMAVVRAVPNGRGLGVFYWDATWTAVEGNGWENTNPASGNGWENQALFDYDDVVLPALDEFLSP